MEWQQLSTAPLTRDGVEVLVFSPQIGQHVARMHRLTGSELPWVNVPCFNNDAVEHWGVTHWMPLPEPPEANS